MTMREAYKKAQIIARECGDNFCFVDRHTQYNNDGVENKYFVYVMGICCSGGTFEQAFDNLMPLLAEEKVKRALMMEKRRKVLEMNYC